LEYFLRERRELEYQTNKNIEKLVGRRILNDNFCGEHLLLKELLISRKKNFDFLFCVVLIFGNDDLTSQVRDFW